MVQLVCSECGGTRLSGYAQRGIDNWPMAVCHSHAKPVLVALMSERAWQGKKKGRHTNALPIDLFGSLSLVEQEELWKRL